MEIVPSKYLSNLCILGPIFGSRCLSQSDIFETYLCDSADRPIQGFSNSNVASDGKF